MSDVHLHIWRSLQRVKKAFKLFKEADVDVVFLLGDFLAAPWHIRKLKLFRMLDIPAFAVLGNHDYGHAYPMYNSEKVAERITSLLEDAGITVLKNECVAIKLAGKKVNVCGVDSMWAKRADLEKTFSSANKKLPTILLAHNPDIVLDMGKEKTNLVLAGHTHGFPMGIPGTDLRIVHTKLGLDYASGLNEFNGRKLFVTTGLGSMPQPRGGIPREIILIDLEL